MDSKVTKNYFLRVIITILFSVALIVIFECKKADVSTAKNNGTLEAILEEGNKLIGTPYQMAPTDVPKHFDDASFIWYIYKISGKEDWERGTAQTAQAIFDQCTLIPENEVQAGELIFFKDTYENGNGNEITHVGIYCGDGTMIHVEDVVKYSKINTSYWQQHLVGYGRLN